VKYRISTTVGSPGTWTVRRSTRRGRWNRGESTVGEVQPFTHVSDASPLVGGGWGGSAGGVGDASDGVDGNGDEVDGSSDGLTNGSGPSQAAIRMSSDATIMRFFMR
jgi:hypothetical protein